MAKYASKQLYGHVQLAVIVNFEFFLATSCRVGDIELHK